MGKWIVTKEKEVFVDSVRGLPQAIWNLGTRTEEKTVSTLEGICPFWRVTDL